MPSFIAPSGRYQTFLLCAVSSCTNVPLGLASSFQSAFFHTCMALPITLSGCPVKMLLDQVPERTACLLRDRVSI